MRCKSSRPRTRCRHAGAARGFILLLVLVGLGLMSLMMAAALRSTTTAENNAAATRRTGIASEAAAAALEFCETAAVSSVSGTATTSTLLIRSAIDSPRYSESLSDWDATTAPTVAVNVMSLSTATGSWTWSVRRAPECVIETAVPSPTATKVITVTARGFGPEVPPRNTSGTRPSGTVVWQQSVITIP